MTNFKKTIAALLAVVMILPFVSFANGEKLDIDGHWAEEEMEYLIEKEVLNGYSDGSFRPDREITRAEFIKIMNSVVGYSELGQVDFKDVDEDDWFYDEISKAVKAGYIEGYDDNTARPNNPITRQEASLIIATVFDIEEVEETSDEFKDASKIGDWAKDAVNALKEAGYLTGYTDGTFRPQNSITRAESSTIIVRVIEDGLTDDEGNENEEKDTIAPVFDYEGETELTVEKGAEFTVPEVTATDNVDEEVEVSYVIADAEEQEVETIDTTGAGTYTITYSAVDAAGNEAEELVITVTVVERELTLEEKLEEAKEELKEAKIELAKAEEKLADEEFIDSTHGGNYENVIIAEAEVKEAEKKVKALEEKVAKIEAEIEAGKEAELGQEIEAKLNKAEEELEQAKAELKEAEERLADEEFIDSTHGGNYENVIIAEAEVKEAEKKVNEAETKLEAIKESYKVEIELMEAKKALAEAEDRLLTEEIIQSTHGGNYENVIIAEAEVEEARERLEKIQNVLDQNVINRSQIKGYETIQEAIDEAKAGDVIVVSEGTYELSKQLLITKAVTVKGIGEVVIKAAEDFDEGTYNADKHLITIAGVEDTVTLENLTVSNSKRTGINVFESADVQLKDIVSKDNSAAGLGVTNSKVVAENLKTSGNAWYGVNVDNGSNSSEGAPETEFILVSGEISEEVQIISDKGGVEVTVPEDYTEVKVEGTDKIIWTNRPSENQ